MLTFAEMPDTLELEVLREDVVGSCGGNAFCCPIARCLKRLGIRHDGVTRGLCFFNGAPYLALPDAVEFMDEVDDGVLDMESSRKVSFRRRRETASPERRTI